MALDGIFLKCLKNEIKSEAVSMRVEKIHQPSREEILLILRGKNGSKKLLLSARANSPRINFTNYTMENPKKPPMLCMLFRKYLTNAMICDVRQYETDRVLFIDFDATNEIGDKIKLSLCIEIMAQHSNVILLDNEGRIIDALKRVDFSKSTVRQILPGIIYQFPPKQDKFDIEKADVDEIILKIMENKNKYLSSAIISTIQGVSPIMAREVAFASAGDDIYCEFVCENSKRRLKEILLYIKESISNNSLCPYTYFDEENKPKDFAFLNVSQYGNIGKCEKFESFSKLLDEFYYEKDRLERTKQKSNDLYKFLQNTLARIAKKINLQKADLQKCEDKEKLKIYAELINAYQFNLQKGSLFYEVENYYDENKKIKIPVDPALSPSANSQKYYKEYRKAKTAQIMLQKLIEENEHELAYIESVIDELNRSETESEISEIRFELSENGYGKKRLNANSKKNQKNLQPIEYETSDGFLVLVGRNNIQNDYLTFKKSRNNDMWLHTKDFPGSHTIIISDNKEISDKAIEEASVIAAYHSKARESYQVQVNYTLVKNLKKPPSAKPGKVIYHTYYTITANPDINLIKKLKK